jgi:guanylate kinase
MTMVASPRGRLVVVSGPSGVGKTTVIQRLLATCPLPLVRSVSATTRAARPGERDGVDYHFLTKAEFAGRRQAGDFLECCEVFGRGEWYGTLLSEVTPSVEAGKWVVLGIDVQGALSVMDRFPEAVTVFIRPRSLDVLEGRLRGRGTESGTAIAHRLEQAQRELAVAGKYQYQVINDDLDQTVREICGILTRVGGFPHA